VSPVALRVVLWVALTVVPEIASACATCIDSAWGMRGFSWPFVGLMLAPFAVVAGMAAVVYGYLSAFRRHTDVDDS
jgi:hypothetical protein